MKKKFFFILAILFLSFAVADEDNVAPTSVITSPKNGAILRGVYVTIKGTSEDESGIKKVEVSTNNGLTWHLATGTTSWYYKWKLPADGIYVIRARATDLNDNKELLGPKITVTVDNTPPDLKIDFFDGQLLKGTTVKITGTCRDATGISKIEISLDNKKTWNLVQGKESWSYDLKFSEDGLHEIVVRSFDVVGNLLEKKVTVIVDNTFPQLSINLSEGQILKGDVFTITGTARDENGLQRLEISTDGGQTWIELTGESWKYDWILPESGQYLVKVKALDGAGNETMINVNVTVEKKSLNPLDRVKSFVLSLDKKMFIFVIVGILIFGGLILVVLYFRTK